MKEEEKEEYLQFFKKTEGDDFGLVINHQIQRVVGLLEGGRQAAGIASPEYASLREAGGLFLNDTVRIARKLNVQLQ
jgi:hypothetical protein